MKACGKCKIREAKPGQRYCRECFAAYFRDYRRTQEQRTMQQWRRRFIDALEFAGDWNGADSLRNMRLP